MKWLVKALAVTLYLPGVLAPAPAEAAPRQHFRLEYVVAPGLRCPASAQVKSEVSSRMAHDPWSRRAKRVIHLQVTSTVAGMEARIWVRQVTGRRVGERTFRSREGNCGELMEHVAFHLALVMDPLGLRFKRRPQVKRPPPPVERPASRPATPWVTPRVRSGVSLGKRQDHLAISLGGLFAVGAAAGDLSGGLTAQVRYRFWLMSVGLEGRVDLPAHEAIEGVEEGRISTTLVAASVIPCFHRQWLAVCGVFTAGAIRGQPRGLKNPTIETLPYLAGGIRAGVEIDLSPAFSLRLYGDLVVPAPVQFEEKSPGTRVFWTTPAINGALGLALAAGFL